LKHYWASHKVPERPEEAKTQLGTVPREEEKEELPEESGFKLQAGYNMGQEGPEAQATSEDYSKVVQDFFEMPENQTDRTGAA